MYKYKGILNGNKGRKVTYFKFKLQLK